MEKTEGGIIVDERTAKNLRREKESLAQVAITALSKNSKTRSIAQTLCRLPIETVFDMLPYLQKGARFIPDEMLHHFPRKDRRAIEAARTRAKKKARFRARQAGLSVHPDYEEKEIEQ